MENAVAGRELALRAVVAVPVAVVCVVLLAGDLFMLLYWLPVLFGPGDVSCDVAPGACWRPEQPIWWGVAGTLTAFGAGCEITAVRGFRRAGLWWPWLYGAMGLLLAAAFAAAQIS
ncbi:hypothetical protein [Paractinoplanes lichenicola]|uniref:Uncharacterized protein n=1 Tax=Paractinoplanes lichenicola TaxID=2802976 RepID=A0ABS1W6E7_9ACTN|nr:hypothetical protein [Actinoplanes lichenicola]MBL7262292.1 hypothetical protein [Actinoplanes lichenicola]